jgi:hypothetical protein
MGLWYHIISFLDVALSQGSWGILIMVHQGSCLFYTCFGLVQYCLFPSNLFNQDYLETLAELQRSVIALVVRSSSVLQDVVVVWQLRWRYMDLIGVVWVQVEVVVLLVGYRLRSGPHMVHSYLVVFSALELLAPCAPKTACKALREESPWGKRSTTGPCACTHGAQWRRRMCFIGRTPRRCFCPDDHACLKSQP